MICAHISFENEDGSFESWVPPAMRDSECLLRKSNPEKWTGILQSLGEEASVENCQCLRNLESNWEECPLYVPRGGRIKLTNNELQPYSILPLNF